MAMALQGSMAGVTLRRRPTASFLGQVTRTALLRRQALKEHFASTVSDVNAGVFKQVHVQRHGESLFRVVYNHDPPLSVRSPSVLAATIYLKLPLAVYRGTGAVDEVNKG